MSKERELLIESLEWMQELKYVWADERDSGDRLLLIADINKVEQLLAQPEHIVDVTDMVEPELEQSNKWWYEKGVEDTKYFLTRKPLSKEQYMKFFTDTYDSVNPITDFVRAIEKAHGITGVNNNE